MTEKSKRVGLAICYDYHDYGSMLQAYATQVTVEEMGWDSEALNINSIKSSMRKRKIKYFLKNIFDFSVVKEKWQIVKKRLKIKSNKKFKKNISLRDASFTKFYNEHFKTSREFSDWGDLMKECNDYSAVIVGSDQLWLPSNIAADYYTLSFVPEDVKKISYATSFGIPKIVKSQRKIARKFLSRIEYLSARELSGCKIIKDFTDRDVPLVCDPALLLDSAQWDRVATPDRIIQDKYIFCYFMGNNPWQREFVKKLKAKTGYKIVALLHLDQVILSDEQYVDYAPYNISPADFLSLVKHAEYVCTDSFHGTVFSVIYSKPFFTFKRFSEKATLSTNTRIYSLLEKLNLQDRLMTEKYNLEDNVLKQIDFNAVHK